MLEIRISVTLFKCFSSTVGLFVGVCVMYAVVVVVGKICIGSFFIAGRHLSDEARGLLVHEKGLAILQMLS